MATQRRDLIAFRIAGFRIRVDPTWLVLAALISLSLTYGVFPRLYQGLSGATYFAMAVIALFGLTLSIVLHELGHSLVARARGLPVDQVTLFMFGGAAELEAEPADAQTEFLMALAGPAVSVAIGAALLFLHSLAGGGEGFGPWDVIQYLGVLNLALAAFNMIPSFPLDGGRVLRAVIWMITGDRYGATRRAVQVSQAFTLILMLLGALSALSGAVVGGLWQVVIALFIRGAVFGAWRDAQARRFLDSMTVRDFLVGEASTAPAEMRVDDFVEQRLYPDHHALFPVVGDGELVGVIDAETVGELPRNAWRHTTVGEICAPVTEEILVAPDADAADTLARMTRQNAKTLLVVEDGALAGVLGVKDMLDHLRVKTILEG